jgi:hypothetical protein
MVGRYATTFPCKCQSQKFSQKIVKVRGEGARERDKIRAIFTVVPT